MKLHSGIYFIFVCLLKKINNGEFVFKVESSTF